MKDTMLYLLQTNILFVAFFLLYKLILSEDTFFRIKRCYLFFVPIIVLLLPFLRFSVSHTAVEYPVVVAAYMDAVEIIAPSSEELFWSWQELLRVVWYGGILYFGVCFLYQLCFLAGVIYKGRKVRYGEQLLCVNKRISLPCSFFGWLFLDPDRYSDTELQEIILHERAHMEGLHSVDVLLWQLIKILFWFNPMVWLFMREVRHNLEFIADREVLRTEINKKHYQHLLLNLSYNLTAVTLTNNFNVSQLKKRIIMMNNKPTNRIGLLKYLGILPVVMLAMIMTDAHALVENSFTDSFLEQHDSKGKLSGCVVSEDGKALQGVSIVVKGSTLGTLSDANGNFELKGVSRATLCFSYVGREQQIIYCSESDNVNRKITLPISTTKMDEIVVVTYGNKKTKDVGSKSDESQELFMVVEEMPTFREGSAMKYLASNVKYPIVARDNGIEGDVYVQFVISCEGKVENVKIVKSIDPSLDAEAIRIVSQMPAWNPGKQRGKAVAVQLTLPIKFKINEQIAE